MEQMDTKHSYWVNKTQILADEWNEIEQDGETWLVFKIKGKLVMAVRRSELFELKIDIPIGDGMYQDTMECKHWERYFPSQEVDAGGMVFVKP